MKLFKEIKKIDVEIKFNEVIGFCFLVDKDLPKKAIVVVGPVSFEIEVFKTKKEET